jgi:hypothetical protein
MKKDECLQSLCDLNQGDTKEDLSTMRKQIENLIQQIDYLSMNRIQQTNTEEKESQIHVTINVKRQETMALIDCGADINYVNEEWCKTKGFRTTHAGFGNVQGFDGKRTRVPIKETVIPFRMDGRFQNHKFRVIRDTGSDKIVLGMPWLRKENPDIDWSSRTVKISGIASKETEGKKEQPVPQEEKLENGKDQRELEEIRRQLSDEIKDFADVFSTEG